MNKNTLWKIFIFIVCVLFGIWTFFVARNLIETFSFYTISMVTFIYVLPRYVQLYFFVLVGLVIIFLTNKI